MATNQEFEKLSLAHKAALREIDVLNNKINELDREIDQLNNKVYDFEIDRTTVFTIVRKTINNRTIYETFRTKVTAKERLKYLQMYCPNDTFELVEGYFHDV